MTGLLVVFLLAGTSCARAQQYPVSRWEAVSDQSISQAFERATGLSAWKMQKGQMGFDTVFVASPPQKKSARVSRGRLRNFVRHLDKTGEWLEFPHAPKDYVVIKSATKESESKQNADLIVRVYNRPIFIDETLSDQECEEVVDAMYAALVDARRDGSGQADVALLKGKPYFGELAGISRNPHGYWVPSTKDIPRSSLLHVGLSQGGDGALIFAFDRKSGRPVITEILGVDF